MKSNILILVLLLAFFNFTSCLLEEDLDAGGGNTSETDYDEFMETDESESTEDDFDSNASILYDEASMKEMDFGSPDGIDSIFSSLGGENDSLYPDGNSLEDAFETLLNATDTPEESSEFFKQLDEENSDYNTYIAKLIFGKIKPYKDNPSEQSIWRLVIGTNYPEVEIKVLSKVRFEKKDKILKECGDNSVLEIAAKTRPGIDGVVFAVRVPKDIEDAALSIKELDLVVKNKKLVCYTGNEDLFTASKTTEILLSHSDEPAINRVETYVKEEAGVGLMAAYFETSENRVGALAGRWLPKNQDGEGAILGKWITFKEDSLDKHGKFRGRYTDQFVNENGESRNIVVAKYVLNTEIGPSFGGYILGNYDQGEFSGYYFRRGDLTAVEGEKPFSDFTVLGTVKGKYDPMQDDVVTISNEENESIEGTTEEGTSSSQELSHNPKPLRGAALDGIWAEYAEGEDVPDFCKILEEVLGNDSCEDGDDETPAEE